MKNNPAFDQGEPFGSPFQCGPNLICRILVVDDDKDVRRLSTNVLQGSGYRVDAAEDGAVAWDALQAKNYNLLITDNNMPNISGIELVKKLRAARMDLPIIMASGTILPEALSQHWGLQLAATLLKPFTGDDLLEAVKKVLGTTAKKPDARSAAGQPSILSRSVCAE